MKAVSRGFLRPSIRGHLPKERTRDRWRSRAALEISVQRLRCPATQLEKELFFHQENFAAIALPVRRAAWGASARNNSVTASITRC